MSNHYKYGINVKVYNMPDIPGETELSDETRQRIWDSVCEEFWETMNARASEFGINKFYSEGRMGGWLVPDPLIDPDSAKFEELKREVNNEISFYVNDIYVMTVKQAIADLESRREACIIRSNN